MYLLPLVPGRSGGCRVHPAEGETNEASMVKMITKTTKEKRLHLKFCKLGQKNVPGRLTEQ